MSGGIEAEAPGKVVLLGEYAVLEGVGGLAMAVDRHARVNLRVLPGSSGRICAPQLAIPPACFELSPVGNMRWKTPHRGAFVTTAGLVERLLSDRIQRGARLSGFELTIDTEALFMRRGNEMTKLGLGSSAALTVAVDAALRRAFPVSGEHVESLAARVERLRRTVCGVQGGHASGIDLAASLAGGLVDYQLRGDSVMLERQNLPEGLAMRFVWTGRPASTKMLLGHWAEARRRNPAAVAGLIREMAASASSGRRAVADNDTAELVEQIGVYGRIMGKMNDLMPIPVFSEAHRHAARGANRLGLVYKPCGAGGGDLGVAASTDPDRLARYARWLSGTGMMPLSLAVSQRGLWPHDE